MTKGQYLKLILQKKGLTYQNLADLMMEYRKQNNIKGKIDKHNIFYRISGELNISNDFAKEVEIVLDLPEGTLLDINKL